ncbi:MAG: DUF1836 domain-containing protein [Filifactor alocis]|nr:DUF1836 domain-containing protein [Filifactor alocis]
MKHQDRAHPDQRRCRREDSFSADRDGKKEDRAAGKKEVWYLEERLRREIALSVKDFGLPKYEDIPDIGMFLDQVTKYISKYMEPLESITITSSMISNYVKMGLIENPIKKQYYTEQIACLIFITLAKSVLSLEEIKLCMENQKQICDMRTSYEYFRKEF